MDEKMRILKMVEEGKLSAEQAISLIDALEEAPEEESAPEESAPEESRPEESRPEEPTPEESTPEEPTPEKESDRYAGMPVNQFSVIPNSASYEDKMLRVVVDSPVGDKVNVQLPVKVIRQLLKVTGKLPIKSEEMQGIDFDALTASILECLDSGTLGNIVEVSAADGTTVRVFIE